VAHSYKQLRKALLPLPEPRSPEAKEWRQAVTPARQHQRFTRLTTNQERYERMGELQKRGVPQQEIARQLGVTVRTLQNWNKRGACPGSTQRRRRRSIFDLYAPSVLSHWQQGHRDVTLLFQEIQAQGYPGKIRTVYRFIQTLKQNPAQFPALSVLDRVSVQEAVWLIARPFEDLKADERVDLEELCQASPTLSILHTLVQSFGRLVRKREGHRLEDWKKQVRESGLPEMQSFVKGLERDREAVLAGLTESYSNGMTEGFVNKLKLIKRQCYGRASFPLLRQRVLHAL